MRTLLTFAAMGVLGASASANLFTNSSFEDPDQHGGWSYMANDGVAGGWYAHPNSQSQVIEIGNGSVYGVTASEGVQVLELDSDMNSTVAQDLFLTEGNYSFSFDYALRSGVDPSSGQLSIFLGDHNAVLLEPTSTNFTTWTGILHVYDTGTYAIGFTAEGTSDSYGALVDNVKIESVPEPASMAVLGLGVAAFFRRCRAAK